MLTSIRRFRLIAFTILLVFVLAACGQRPGVHVAGNSGDSTGGIDGGAGAGAGAGTATGTGSTAGTGGATGTAGAAGTAGGAGTAGTAGTAGGTTGQVIGTDRTGISETEIIIGIHAPTTGAAPVTAEAFRAGKDLYWNWLKDSGKKVHGKRNVKVLFANDEYTPSTAVSVCNQMTGSGRAFLLIGGAGADQIGACAREANARGIPYFSPGVQNSGLDRFRTYFAVTMTYAQQVPLLLQLLKKENAGNALAKLYGNPNELKVGFVRPDTGNFDDASDALKANVGKYGIVLKQYIVAKEGSSSEAQTLSDAMQNDGIDVVFPITAPTFTTQLAAGTGSKGYYPKYAGIGITNNINQMINTVCRGNSRYDGALFLSPWPGWKQVMGGEYDPDFAKAARKFGGGYNTRDGGGDILLALWGIMKTIHQAFEAAGPNMTREHFVAVMNNFSLKTKVFPDLQYAPTNHFGARNVHTLIGRCDERADSANGVSAGAQYVTYDKYKGLRSSF